MQQAVLLEPTEEARPFLKWVGGKRQLLAPLLAAAPHAYGTYFEPFVGGGALFFALRPKRAILADVNTRLIRTYRGVRNKVEDVIRLLKSYPHDEKFFYELRQIDIDTGSDAEVAAWFIYLNKVGFNGLYRVNRDNRFNVPFGRYTNPTICDAANLRRCAAALSDVELLVTGFDSAVRSAKRNDFVYFDPPYVPLSATSSFTSYTCDGFTADDQRRLRDVALRLKQRGTTVLISNSSAAFVRDLYGTGFTIQEVNANRRVNSQASKRGPIPELIIR